MRIAILLCIPFIFLYGCVSSEKNSSRERDYQNLVSLNQPGDQKQEKSNIYIDSIKLIQHDNKKALLISGSFPDACTHLKKAAHTLSNDTLNLTLEAWRNPSAMCAQVLTSFSYIYKDVPQEVLEKISSVKINSRTYQIN